LWRVAIDENAGTTSGEPQPLPAPAWYVADFSLSADGTAAVYSSIVATSNLARVAFDPKAATVSGNVEMVTTGTNDFVSFDVTNDARFAVLTTSSRTREDVFVLTMADGTMRQLTNDFARDRWPRWSPDARSIYFYSDRHGYEVWRINADGSGLREVTTEPALKEMYPSISADGTRLAASDQDLRKVAIYDTRDFSKPLRIVMPDIEPREGALRVMGWSPDGRSILLNPSAPGTGGGMLWLYNVETGAARRLGEGVGGTWTKDGRHVIVGNRSRLVVRDVETGRETELDVKGGGLGVHTQLAAEDTQLYFMRLTFSADIWLARFSEPTVARRSSSIGR